MNVEICYLKLYLDTLLYISIKILIFVIIFYSLSNILNHRIEVSNKRKIYISMFNKMRLIFYAENNED